MYGLTAEGVGVAVRRALAHATDWTDYDWQLIHEGPQSPALHMALDEVLTDEVAAGRRPPTLRVWEWDVPGRHHRQLPVAAQRGRPGGRGGTA